MSHSITFLHAADLHLDSPFKGISDVPEQVFHTMRESTFQAFDRLIQTAIDKKVNFILLVGDLFDEKTQSLKAQLHLRDGFSRLEAEGIEVFLSYGNHDYIKGNPYPITYPDNVHIFSSEQVSALPYRKDGQNLAHIHGFSYENREVYDNKATQFQVTDSSFPYQIAMLHGSLHGEQGHDPYAPFRLEDLRQEPFDYWALGHIHQGRILQDHPPVVYPGNIQGRHRKEAGLKGCYYVRMNKWETKLQFVPLQQVMIMEETFPLTSYETMADIKQALMNKLTAKSSKDTLIHLTLETDQVQNERLGIENRVDELIDLLNTQLLEASPWHYIYHYKVKLEEEATIQVDSFFMDEIKEAVHRIHYEEAIDDLYSHPEAKKHLHMTDEKEMIDRAIRYVKEEMSKRMR